MVFISALPLPSLPDGLDSITVAEFMSDQKYGRHAPEKSRNPYTCGLTGKTYSAASVIKRIDYLARAIQAHVHFDPLQGTELDRVVCVYSFNTIDYVPITHAVHRLSGVVTPASTGYSVSELEHQLRTSGAKALFTCVQLLDNALQAASAVGIPNSHIFILPMSNDDSVHFKTVDNLVQEGKRLPAIRQLEWSKGQGKTQTAFMCYSSGTSGLPKAVMISHYNIITSVLQTVVFEAAGQTGVGIETQVSLGVLPFSHIYGLALLCHVAQYRGDQVVVLPKFDLNIFCSAIQRFHIQLLSVVPPMLIQMLSNESICTQYDLSSVRLVISGAAPLGSEVLERLEKLYPKWKIGQAYGMTECTGVCIETSESDILSGSVGTLIPNVSAKLVGIDGQEITQYETPGEIWIQSPILALGYLNNDKANSETFVSDSTGRWLRTGDEAIVRKSSQGNDHFIIVDRIKELIKVKGHQVAPAELESHLLGQSFVDDCAVIGIPHHWAGQVPKVFIVKSKEAVAAGIPEKEIENAVRRHVEDHKAKHKWLDSIEFIDAIPKSPSGKILRRVLREKEKMSREELKGKL